MAPGRGNARGAVLRGHVRGGRMLRKRRKERGRAFLRLYAHSFQTLICTKVRGAGHSVNALFRLLPKSHLSRHGRTSTPAGFRAPVVRLQLRNLLAGTRKTSVCPPCLITRCVSDDLITGILREISRDRRESARGARCRVPSPGVDRGWMIVPDGHAGPGTGADLVQPVSQWRIGGEIQAIIGFATQMRAFPFPSQPTLPARKTPLAVGRACRLAGEFR